MIKNTGRILKLPIESIKVGTLVWWKADRFMSCWDCPGIITNVDLKEETFRVKTFDTMKESDNISFYAVKLESDPTTEFTLCNKLDIADYLNRKRLDISKVILEKEFEITQLRINSGAVAALLEEYLK